MDQDFNGYAAWLGIDADAGPIHYYRLLGLKTFDAQPARLNRALKACAAKLQPHLHGPQRPIAARILNEAAAAERCLRDPQKKAAYDAQIRQLDAADPAPTRDAPLPPNPAECAPPASVPQNNGAPAAQPAKSAPPIKAPRDAKPAAAPATPQSGQGRQKLIAYLAGAAALLMLFSVGVFAILACY